MLLLSKFWYQLLTMALSVIKKIENYQQTFYVITQNNGNSKNRDDINFLISQFYSLNF